MLQGYAAGRYDKQVSAIKSRSVGQVYLIVWEAIRYGKQTESLVRIMLNFAFSHVFGWKGIRAHSDSRRGSFTLLFNFGGQY